MSQPQINMQRVYLKGASLEMPGAPQSFLTPGQVQVHSHLDIAISSVDLGDSAYEVAVRCTLTLTHPAQGADASKVLAIVEGEQAGVFTLTDVPANDVQAVLSVGCAQALFPYLRVNIADSMTRATLQPFHLPDVNFGAMFQQAQQANQPADASPVTVH